MATESNAQADDAQAVNAQAVNAQAVNAQASNAQAAHAQAANVRASNAQASNAQASNAQAAGVQAAPWTVGRLLTWTTEHFRTCGVDEPRLAAEVLLAKAMDCSRIRLYTQFEDAPPEDALTAYRESVKAAANHAPIAHLVGEREFYSLSFEVTPDTLIPRPETETLVEQTIALCKREGWSKPRIMDLGTGSGCVMVAILTQIEGAIGTATDVCPAATAVASRNAESHGVSDRMSVVVADGFAFHDGAGDGASVAGGFQVLVSNPPYIAEGEIAELPSCVRDHEPRSALVGGVDGLDFYRMIAADAGNVLGSEGHVLVEIGAGQASDVREIFVGGGGFEHVGTYNRAPDPHDRVVHFRRV